jgi:hypothetical protein
VKVIKWLNSILILLFIIVKNPLLLIQFLLQIEQCKAIFLSKVLYISLIFWLLISKYISKNSKALGRRTGHSLFSCCEILVPFQRRQRFFNCICVVHIKRLHTWIPAYPHQCSNVQQIYIFSRFALCFWIVFMFTIVFSDTIPCNITWLSNFIHKQVITTQNDRNEIIKGVMRGVK